MSQLRSVPYLPIGGLPVSHRLGALSRVYRSAAVGPGPSSLTTSMQPCCLLDTDLLPPMALLDTLQHIEIELRDGCARIRWGPRTLDLDILLYG